MSQRGGGGGTGPPCTPVIPKYGCANGPLVMTGHIQDGNLRSARTDYADLNKIPMQIKNHAMI